MTADAGTVLPWRPRVVAESAEVDLEAAEEAAAALLTALGQPLDSPHLAETPRRLATAYSELLTAEPFDFTTFPNTEAYDEFGSSLALDRSGRTLIVSARGEDGGGRGEGGKQTDNSVDEAGAVYAFRISQ